MTIQISQIGKNLLQEYARIPIAFTVNSIFEVAVDPDGSIALTEKRLAVPYIKDYDVPDQRPLAWQSDFDLSNWGFFLCRIDGNIVGAAAIAYDTPELELLEGRADLAVLWDIRVDTNARRSGIGTALLHAAEGWARERGCTELKIETQNNNVPACRFYGRRGYSLRRANFHAYPDFPDEVQLLWYRKL